jgi:putative SOS response-associated peptidase YedK
MVRDGFFICVIIMIMCGRFTLSITPEQLAALFELDAAPILAPRYNIAPTQPVGFVRFDAAAESRVWHLAHWGLIPSWSKDPSLGAKMINARGETVDEKPSFRTAFKRRRCIVPATGFYEWKQGGSGKTPYFISPAADDPMPLFDFAGLWETWTGPDGGQLDSCTIITTEANELMAELHNRMPVILAPADFTEWLGTGRDASAMEQAQLRHLLHPYPSERMQAWPVSTYVNRPGNEGARCSERTAS